MADLPDERRRLREDALILGQALADRRAEDPLLTFDRTLAELRDLGVSDTAYRKIVRENAIRAFGLEG